MTNRLPFLTNLHNTDQLWKFVKKGNFFQLKCNERGTFSVKMVYKRVRSPPLYFCRVESSHVFRKIDNLSCSRPIIMKWFCQLYNKAPYMRAKPIKWRRYKIHTATRTVKLTVPAMGVILILDWHLTSLHTHSTFPTKVLLARLATGQSGRYGRLLAGTLKEQQKKYSTFCYTLRLWG